MRAHDRVSIRQYACVLCAAYVGDQKWAEWFVKLIGPFTRAEERMFHPDS